MPSATCPGPRAPCTGRCVPFSVSSGLKTSKTPSPAPHNTYRAALREANELDALVREARQLGQAKQEVLEDLSAGRLTLAAAADRFHRLSAASRVFPVAAVRKTFPAACEQESWCRCVLSCAR